MTWPDYEGLVERRRAHTDQRRILCFATPTGSAAAAAAAGAVDEAFRTTLRVCTRGSAPGCTC